MTITIQRVAVLGAGSWGTTFAKVLADAGRDVVLWARRPDVAAAITERPIGAAPALRSWMAAEKSSVTTSVWMDCKSGPYFSPMEASMS